MDCDIIPVILACDREPAITLQFVSSLQAIRPALQPPIVILDISSSPRISGQFLQMISSVEPRAVHVHPREPGMSVYDSVQEAASFAMEKALEESPQDTMILFMEDDIRFSKLFVEKLNSLDVAPDTGFVTFYLPGDEYGSITIDPSRFYGTQCLVFPRHAVSEIVEHREYMRSAFYPGYDIRWSRFLAERGYRLYATDRSYVQHLAAISRLNGYSSHVSNRFVE